MKPDEHFPTPSAGTFLGGLSIALVATLLLSGCGGGADNAEGPPPGDSLHVRCLEKPDPGPCRAAKPAYHYDYQSDSCRRFTYGGCKGKVPFETLKECQQMCGAR